MSRHMPTVRISMEYYEILMDKQEEFEEEHGFAPQKKELVEDAIGEVYDDE